MNFKRPRRIRLCAVLGAVLAIAVALPAQAQTMSLVITNSNTNFTDNDIYVSFECGLGASGIVGTYGGGTPFSVINSATYQYYSTSTSTIASTSPQAFAITAPLTLAQLNAGSGMQFTTATSLRAYVSLGQPLVLSSTAVGTPGAWTSGFGQNAAALSFGMPTYANSTADPNWNVRWDIFEFNVTPAYGDQGDSTLINAVGIPMQMTSFSSGSAVQSAKATSDFQTLRTQLQAYQAANAGNNAANLPTYVTTSGSFVRLVGINNGSQAIGTGSSVTPSTWVVSSSTAAGQQAQIGANASFGPYVNAISSGSVTTPLKMDNVVGSFGFTGTLSAAPWTQSGQTLTATWPRLSSGTVAGTVSGTLTSVTTGGTGAALRVTGQFRNGATSVGTYTVTLPPDNVTASGTNFLQSATIYAGDPLANYGLIFEYTPVSTGSSTTYYLWQDFTNAVDLDTGNNGQALIKQVFHDVSGGLNFGLVGSNEIDVLSGTTFNAIGSEGWTQWETIKNLGTVTTTTGTWSYTGDAGTQNPGPMPLYQNQWGEAAGFYNQWAKIIYDSSDTAYGNPYSDYLQQVDVNVLTAPNTSAYNIDYVQVTILPDTAVVPEPSAVALVIAAGATLGGIEWRRKRWRSSRREASTTVLPGA